MTKNYSSMFISLIFIVFLSFITGCGGSDSIVPVNLTPTSTFIPGFTPTPHVISSLTEIEAKRVTISPQKGCTVTEGNMEVNIPENAVTSDCQIEVAKINIKEITTSNKNGVTEMYKISSGAKGVQTELSQSGTVKIKTGGNSNSIPMMWSGEDWLPVDYTYDPNTQEIILEVTCLDEDIDEWIEYGGDKGKIEEPLAIAIGQSTDYEKDPVTTERFRVFYTNSVDKAYAESAGKALEVAYSYYAGLKYKEPVKTLLKSKNQPKYIYAFIYANSGLYGTASPNGYMKFNKTKCGDPNTFLGKTTFYHELLHLVEFNYTGRGLYDNWFDESMVTCMEFYAGYDNVSVNKKIMYDIKGERWDPDVMQEIFNDNKSKSWYDKFFVWSYIFNDKTPKVLDTIMSNFAYDDKDEVLNDVCKKQLNKEFVTYFNEIAEDYYIKGKFYNKTYFNNLENRVSGQPYASIIEKGEDPNNVSNPFSIKPLSVQYICYKSTNFKGSVTFTGSGISSNCTIKIYSLKNNSGTYTLVKEETMDSTNTAVTVNNFGTDVTNIFILMENTSISSTAEANIKIKVLK